MNKNLVIGLGGLVGIGAAVALFFATQPSGPADVVVVETTPTEVSTASQREPSEAIQVGAEKKEGEANPNPLAAAAAANRNADFVDYAAKAGPVWQHIGMTLHNSDADLSAACRETSMGMRALSRDPEVDVAAILSDQRALLEEVRGLGAGEEVDSDIARLEELMATLEEAS